MTGTGRPKAAHPSNKHARARPNPQTAVLRLLWHHVSGLLTDLLVSTPDWLAAFDHCLTWGPQFQYDLLAAYLITFRCADS